MDHAVPWPHEGHQQGRYRRHPARERKRVVGVLPYREAVFEDFLVGAVEARIDQALGPARALAGHPLEKALTRGRILEHEGRGEEDRGVQGAFAQLRLDVAVRSGDLTHEDRDRLLRDVTEDVVRHVLEDSYLQAQIIAQEVRESAARVFAYEDLMSQLEEEGLLNRRVERLPPSDEMAERRRAGDGMVRPERAVLLADEKRTLPDALLDGTLGDEPFFESDLRGYFPPA